MWCSLSADKNITDLLQREHRKTLTQSDHPLSIVELSVTDIRWQIAAKWLEIAKWSQWGRIGNGTRSNSAISGSIKFKMATTDRPPSWNIRIRVSLHSFSCFCLRNLRNPAKFSQKYELITVQGHPRSSILVSIESSHATSY